MVRLWIAGVLALAVMGAGIARADKYGFESNWEGMAEKLSRPASKNGMMGGKGMDWGGEGKAGMEDDGYKDGGMGTETNAPRPGSKVTALTLRGGRQIKKQVVVPAGRAGGFVNLKITFDSGSARIQAKSNFLLEELAMALESPGVRGRTIYINGHTDSDGSDAYNLELSLRRAAAVKKKLAAHGVDGGRLIPMGFGEALPVASNEGKAKEFNRRVEIVAGE